MVANIIEEEKNKYKKLTKLFKKYENYKFNPFDKVLIYFRDRGNTNGFTIVPHVVWYYDENEKKHVLYDPTIKFTAQSIIPLDGNEELIGFHGDKDIAAEFKNNLQNQEEEEESKTIYAVLANYLQMEGKRMLKDYVNMERNELSINKKYIDDWFNKLTFNCKKIIGCCIGEE